MSDMLVVSDPTQPDSITVDDEAIVTTAQDVTTVGEVDFPDLLVVLPI